MNFSLKLLKQYVNLPTGLTPEELALKLTLSAVEVEGVHQFGAELENIVVGKVLKVVAHPNADKLQVCTVDVGTEKLQIVCGGSNVRTGVLVAVAKVGAKVRWHGEGGWVTMEPAKIRGVESFGMICASTEIGLGGMFPLKGEKEILDLSSLRLKVGWPLAKALDLDDAVLEIDNKSMTNRPDLWGHYGLAREVAALYHKKINAYKVRTLKSGKGVSLKVKVENQVLCPRYTAVAVAGVKVASSPQWLQKQLLSDGLRPINNIVDITNYVMLDLGEPMHAFDANRLNQNSIIVRSAKDNEEFVALDGQKIKLNKENLVIADGYGPVALAGVIGGSGSGISENTVNIVFEAANFDPVSIRKTATQFNMRTDSSTRFEKSLDPTLCETALAKAVEMTLELCPGAKVASSVVDIKKFHLKTGPIELGWEFLMKKIGAEINKKEVIKIFTGLGFEVRDKKYALSVKVPSWRATKDINIPEDLVEEVARIYGYGNIPIALPSFPINPPVINRLRCLENQLKDVLALSGYFTEVYNYSFVSSEAVKKLGGTISRYVELANPLSEERPFLRRNLLINLLENIRKNIEYSSALRLFEVGKIFLVEEPGARAEPNKGDMLPRQDTWLTAVCAAKRDREPYWEARRILETIMAGLGVEFVLETAKEKSAWQHPSRLGEIKINGQKVGAIYEVNPSVASAFGLDVKVGVVEINLECLEEARDQKDFKYGAIPIYPEVERDLTLVVDKNLAQAKVMEVLANIDPLISGVKLFDVYSGANLPSGRKSLTYRLSFGVSERTLKTEEVDVVQAEIIKNLEQKFGAEVRK